MHRLRKQLFYELIYEINTLGRKALPQLSLQVAPRASKDPNDSLYFKAGWGENGRFSYDPLDQLRVVLRFSKTLNPARYRQNFVRLTEMCFGERSETDDNANLRSSLRCCWIWSCTQRA